MNYSESFNNNHNYPMPFNAYSYQNTMMPVMGMTCMDNMGYIRNMPYMTPWNNTPGSMVNMPDFPAMPMNNNMPFIPDTEMPNLPDFPDGDMPAMPMMPTSPTMPMPAMPTSPTSPTMPMPGMPSNMNNMENMMPSPGMPANQMPSFCQQLMEYAKEMNCMEYMKQMMGEEKK